MKNFIADSSFFELFPDAKLGVLLIKNIKYSSDLPEVVELLRESNEMAKEHLPLDDFSKNEIIAEWREAYQKFKKKKGARCSIEALLKRVEKGNEVGPINTLVDIYNSASLRFGIPAGAEDIDSFVGDMRLTVTEGGDEFYLIAGEENDPTVPGELCYLDDVGAVCRCLNWRDGERTRITEETVDAFLIMETVNPDRLVHLNAALDFIEEMSVKYLNAHVERFMIDSENNSIVIDN